MKMTTRLFSALLTGILAAGFSLPVWAAPGRNFSDDMKCQEPAKITQDQGSASIERKLDHKKSIYYACCNILI